MQTENFEHEMIDRMARVATKVDDIKEDIRDLHPDTRRTYGISGIAGIIGGIGAGFLSHFLRAS